MSHNKTSETCHTPGIIFIVNDHDAKLSQIADYIELNQELREDKLKRNGIQKTYSSKCWYQSTFIIDHTYASTK